MPASLAPLLAFGLLAAIYALYRYRRARSRGDHALAALAAAVTVTSLALSAQAVAAARTPIPPDPWKPVAVAHLTVGVVQHLPAPTAPALSK